MVWVAAQPRPESATGSLPPRGSKHKYIRSKVGRSTRVRGVYVT